jgi:hypothetical protein
MAIETCECKGIRLFTDIVKMTFEAAYSQPGDKYVSDQALTVAQSTYDHLMEQANKPENKSMLAEAQSHLDIMRKGFGSYQAQGVLALEVVRDHIHKSPALQQLLVCGGPFDNPDERRDAAKAVGKACNMLVDDDTMDDVLPELTKLSQKLGCKTKSSYE